MARANASVVEDENRSHLQSVASGLVERSTPLMENMNSTKWGISSRADEPYILARYPYHHVVFIVSSKREARRESDKITKLKL
jgi:hypothetical protein